VSGSLSRVCREWDLDDLIDSWMLVDADRD
jgi:hypothetical protein